MKIELYLCHDCGDKIEEEKKDSKCSCGSFPPHDHVVHYYCNECRREIERPSGNDSEICPNCAALGSTHSVPPSVF